MFSFRVVISDLISARFLQFFYDTKDYGFANDEDGQGRSQDLTALVPAEQRAAIARSAFATAHHRHARLVPHLHGIEEAAGQ